MSIVKLNPDRDLVTQYLDVATRVPIKNKRGNVLGWRYIRPTYNVNAQRAADVAVW